ncbi:MAG: ABC transporter ATP-binding protein [Chloroflexi bacterium]|nr:ABC transporter ATP-binding protein [Chloroflexota bacterium]MCY4247799.1 ABC transporter ATP-binding protein [Chloroflexota bacterium]
MTQLLEARGLGVSYRLGRRWLPALREFNLRLDSGQIIGIVGESGSGKSTAALALMRYLSANGRIDGGELRFLGEDMLAMGAADLRRLWARRIKLVPQNAGAALNPSIRVGPQVAEALKAAKGIASAKASQQVIAGFSDVNLVDPQQVVERYPHELSGGMQQRVAIAMALICQPSLLVLDEPTTGLDVTTEAVILDLLRALIVGRGAGVLYITHNLGVVAQLCQRVVVLYAGEIMEEAPVAQLFASPRHPYTLGLLSSLPKPGQRKAQSRLQTIHGNPPDLRSMGQGCVFAERCPLAIEMCRTQKPPLEEVEPGRLTRCFRWADVAFPAARGAPMQAVALANVDEAGQVVMRTEQLARHFPVPRDLDDMLRGRKPQPIRAVDGVSLRLRQGQTLGLVGESGSGKTTLARIVIGLEARSGGRLELFGADIQGGLRARRHDLLSQVQMVFQNPQNSLNPYRSVRQTLRRPLVKLRGLSTQAADDQARQLLEAVNLRADYADRYPDELSGGEKQRVAIARAFAAQPSLVICDEPVSALDVSVQSAVLNLLADLQAEHGSACLFISHNLSVVGYLADVIAVMYLGQIVEIASADALFRAPSHPYTEALLAAIPAPDPSQRNERIRLADDLPSAQNLPGGCRFHTRCPRNIGEICAREAPPWRETGPGQGIRCHIPLDELAVLQAGAS